MRQASSFANRAQPAPWLSFLIFTGVTAFMAYLKLGIFPDRYLSLGYALPLLFCLWYQDRKLLWGMAVSFAGIAGLKALIVLPVAKTEEPFELLQWVMQLTNIFVVAATVQIILGLTQRLKARNLELKAANDELALKQQEITHQNEELQSQSEQLAQQNEELQQQGEELACQNEELQNQTEELERQSDELQQQAQELQTANVEIGQRERMLQTILGCVAGVQDEREMLNRVCRALIDLLGPSCAAAAVIERDGDDLVVRTQAGSAELTLTRWPLASSFTSVVLHHDRTAFVDDLAARPDFGVPETSGRSFRSVLATPLRVNGKSVGAVKAYSFAPRQWSTQQFQIIEWVAAQCSLALEVMRLQEDLSQVNTHLEEQVRERTAKLQEMVSELEHFSYTITHDMRAPLRAIQGFAGILEELTRDRRTAELEDCLTRISRSAGRMDRLITDALSYSKAVEHELVLVPLDAAEWLRSMIKSYPQFQSPRATVQIEGPWPAVLANEAGLTQCFSNLLDNAVKFVEPGTRPEVRLWAESRGEWVRVWVEDNGIGIPDVMLPRMFQMFQRASKAYDGTGIGLALVRKVAERMGGRVGVESKPGQGSRFWVDLRAHSGNPSSSPLGPRGNGDLHPSEEAAKEPSRRVGPLAAPVNTPDVLLLNRGA
jgi:signal transduction histidine kinase